MVKVFIFAGQSNMQGYGNRLQLNPVPAWAQNAASGWTGAPTASSDPPYTQYQHPTFANAPSLYNSNNTGLMSGVFDADGNYDGFGPKPTSGAISEEGGYGPELSFLAKYRADNPGVELAAIKCVLGGSSLESDWKPPLPDGSNAGPMWLQMAAMISQQKARILGLGKTVEYAGFIWMQGESGASGTYWYLYPPNPNPYDVALRAFFVAVRSITSSAMPIAMGRISNSMLADCIILPMVDGGPRNTADNLRGATNQRRDMQVSVGGDPLNMWWDNDNLPVLHSGPPAGSPGPYDYHFLGSGYLAMGERAYNAWLIASGQTPPPPPPPLVVKFNGAVEPWAVKLNGNFIGGNNDIIEITG